MADDFGGKVGSAYFRSILLSIVAALFLLTTGRVARNPFL